MIKDQKLTKTDKKSFQFPAETSAIDALRTSAIEEKRKPAITRRGERPNYRLRLL
jgi:hypothetical protein